MAGDSEMEEEDAHEILVAYADARAKAHQKRMGRGFFKPPSTGSSSMTSTTTPSSWQRSNSSNGSSNYGGSNYVGAQSGSSGNRDIAALKARTKCRKCGKVGHWARECKSMKSSNYVETPDTEAGLVFPPHGAFFTSADVYMGCDEQIAFVDRGLGQAIQCSRDDDSVCGQEFCCYMDASSFELDVLSPRGESGAMSLSACAQERVSDLHKDIRSSMWKTYFCEHTCLAAQSMTRACLTACVDTGCTRCLIGQDTLLSLERQLGELNIRVMKQATRCRFKFGADFAIESLESVSIPVSLGGRFEVINALVVPGATPLLFSLPLFVPCKL
eukprot:6491835-Amphidinium_carterae.3